MKGEGFAFFFRHEGDSFLAPPLSCQDLPRRWKMNSGVQMKCVPCREDERTASDEVMAEYRSLFRKWKLIEVEGVKRLQRIFSFANFAEALAFTNMVGDLAEAEDHHPAILTEWGKVTVTWWTHKIQGLHRNDFIMASKTDEMYQRMPIESYPVTSGTME
jgi:4a-hydroxytetrahydrobiopterin dehydratase